MILILCEQVSRGLRDADAIVALRDFNGRRHFLQIEKDFLVEQHSHSYLPAAVVHRDPQTAAVLIELPQEAESGFHRLWMRPENLKEPAGVSA